MQKEKWILKLYCSFALTVATPAKVTGVKVKICCSCSWFEIIKAGTGNKWQSNLWVELTCNVSIDGKRQDSHSFTFVLH